MQEQGAGRRKQESKQAGGRECRRTRRGDESGSIGAGGRERDGGKKRSTYRSISASGGRKQRRGKGRSIDALRSTKRSTIDGNWNW